MWEEELYLNKTSSVWEVNHSYFYVDQFIIVMRTYRLLNFQALVYILNCVKDKNKILKKHKLKWVCLTEYILDAQLKKSGAI